MFAHKYGTGYSLALRCVEHKAYRNQNFRTQQIRSTYNVQLEQHDTMMPKKYKE